ncbi:NAD(P)H-binding protein [Pseudomonas sp. BN102]|uniref:NAD(P)-dependent oxidoreductase n=1 Tax=Pseudomonas sp. BN102 TaxID=2567886 RepID=UPI002457B7C9|nr:NAD(P)H-binding protein [Pseudomonas sp. BN102]MDH4612502.1 NADH-flavin reductase [Pseudomonas sp. BN102]
MKNLETPAVKLAIYGAQGALGSALLVEALHRQYEATAVLSDLNSVTARPGIRAKTGNLFDALSVSQSVVGKDAVVCVLSSTRLPAGPVDSGDRAFHKVFSAVSALIDGLSIAGVKRLMVIDRLLWLEQSPDSPAPAAEYLQQRLLRSDLQWTLVETPPEADEPLEFDDFVHAPESNKAKPVEHLRRFAAGALDELMLGLHLRQRVRIADWV